MIDDDNHDYLYLILELADLGQIASWDFKQERYIRNETIFNFIQSYLNQHQGNKASSPPVEQVAQYLFR